jgi:hypothetical protein
MAIETVTELVVNVTTGEQSYVEVEREMPNPRIGEIERRLQEIRSELAQNDWKNDKYIEGALGVEEWEAHKASRAGLRSEYNTLEAELATL